MFVSLILCSNAYRPCLKEFLCAISRDPSFCDYEIILVDQSQDSRIHSLVHEIGESSRVDYYRVNFEGLSRSRNFGLEKAKGAYIMFPDDDCVIPSCTLRMLRDISNAVTLDMMVVGMFDLGGKNRLSYCPFSESRLLRKSEVVQYSTSINFCISRELILNNFDERFGLGARFASSEEHDFLLSNIDGLDRVVYFSDIKIYHPTPADLPIVELVQKIHRNSRGHIELIKKHSHGLKKVLRLFSYFFAPIPLFFLSRSKREFKSRVATIGGRLLGFHWL